MTAKSNDFPVVGVGASAGGLEAYLTLLKALPDDTGAAFVFVQHLDPNHESLMADLLAKHTLMPVRQATDGVRIEPNAVYVIPPNGFIRLAGQNLFVDTGAEDRPRMTVDYFFRSLAAARGDRAIAIVLSGMGTDGTLGARAIKASGGIVLAQSPETANFDSMPRSAIATELVDFTLPIEAMPEALALVLSSAYAEAKSPGALAEAEPDQFRSVLNLLSAHSDNDFRGYKKGTLDRRIRRRMGLRQIETLHDYLRYLRKTPEELSLLFRDLLIGVTNFYRDPESWKVLETEVIDRMIERKANDAPFRAWVPACASGEEAYTLAMIIFDRLARARRRLDVQVFATDINEEAIAVGRAGLYPAAIADDMPASALRTHFTQEGDDYRVSKRLRETVVFATQNVISDPPFSKLDLVSCRNLMIYLEADIQQRLIELFHFALSENGFLFLGSSESADRPSGLFEAVSKTHRIYRRSAVTRVKQGSFPILPSRDRAAAGADMDRVDGAHLVGAELARRVLLDRFAPASVLVNRRFEIQYYHGAVKNYLDFPSGEPTIELPVIAISELKSKLRSVLNRALNEQQPTESLVRNVNRNGQEVSVRIAAEPVPHPGGGGPFILVFFEDASEPRQVEADRAKAMASAPEDETVIKQLQYELQATKEDLQSTIEEMEASNEELKSSNEEVMSMNEELQSTNEELETSREELQSLNEELTTVNSQLEEKVNEVEAANNDLTNLLTSTDIATLFLDPDLRIRRFTPATKALLRIIDTDLNRSIEDLTPRVNDPKLLSDARQVLDKLQPLEAEVRNAEGQYFFRRILPYRTTDNKIQGVVITFTDVTMLRKAANRTAKREKQHEAIAELGRQALSGASLAELLQRAASDVASHLNVQLAKVLELRPDGKSLIMRAGVGWKEGLVGHLIVDAGLASQSGYTLQRASPVVVLDFTSEKRFTAADFMREHKVVCGASVIIGPITGPWGVLSAHDIEIGGCEFSVDDVNFMQSVANTLWLAIAQRRARDEVETERRELRGLADALPFPLAIVSPKERYLFNNKAYDDWGRPAAELEGNHIRNLLGDAYVTAKPHIDKALAGVPVSFEQIIAVPGEAPRHVLTTYAPRRNAAGEPDGFYAAGVDISSQKEAERVLRERTAIFETIGESIPFGLWICDADGRLIYVSQSFLDLVGQTFEEARDFGWGDRLEPGTAEETIAAWQSCIRDGAHWEREHKFIGRDGQTYTVLALGRPVRNEAGEITSWVGLNLDITKRKQEEERIRVISAELDHRVKNILATVSSMVRLTGRSARELGEYQADIEARIQAMARAHSTLAEGSWEGLALSELVENELSPYSAGNPHRVTISGPRLILVPAAAQSLAMALHELTTNAVKYGALNGEGGHVAVTWAVLKESDAKLELRWTEEGLTSIRPPERKGFGSMIIADVVKSQLGADVTMNFQPTGLKCIFLIGERWFRRN
jgi:two-component system CheB/CheR fusion protein